MNHWVSKHAEDKEQCSACGEKIPNASGEGGVAITGRCQGAPPLPRGQHLVCGDCVAGPPFYGKYELVELERHNAFCEKCARFLGDGYYVVTMPDLVKNKAGKVTSAPLFGIWCVPPPSEMPHTCGERAAEVNEDLSAGVSPEGRCEACADEKARYGEARFAPHPGALTENLPWVFGTEEAAAMMIRDDPPMGQGQGWGYEVRPLTRGT